MILTATQCEEFAAQGYLVLPGWYSAASELDPVRAAISAIIARVADRHGLVLPEQNTATPFDSGLDSLRRANRAYVGEVYDAIKQIPAFVRLVCSQRLEAITRQLRPGALPGLAAGGFGIRIDLPGEDHYRADWHQEFPAQFRSLDGLVFWSSLVDLDQSMGQLRLCPGSHRDGLVRVHESNPDVPGSTGAYALALEDREQRIARYDPVALPARAGDLVVMDFLTIHASGVNCSPRARWTMQSRWFNFSDPTGMKLGWCGSFAQGVRIADAMPDLLADKQ